MIEIKWLHLLGSQSSHLHKEAAGWEDILGPRSFKFESLHREYTISVKPPSLALTNKPSKPDYVS